MILPDLQLMKIQIKEFWELIENGFVVSCSPNFYIHMKKFLLPIVAMAFLVACGSNEAKESGESGETTETTTTNDISQNPDYQKGLALIAKNDCLTCHKVDEKLIGPPYRDVANKYAGMSDTIVHHLATKIIDGGAGVWGEVAMTPHPAISVPDAETMVKYILLLKK